MKNHLIITAFLVCASIPVFSQAPAVPNLTADEVIQRLFAQDTSRETRAGGYIGSREYVLENKKLNKRAVMTVAVFGDADGTKHFQVVSEEGWKGANKHVFRNMMTSESETSIPETRPKTRIVPQNYEFRLIGSEVIAGRPAHLLEASPKRSDRYLFRGRIWVDAEDYAIAQVEGEPAKNPSFWIRHVHFVQQYQKNGPFWFPHMTTSVTEARIFGTTNVSIRYSDYRPLTSPQQQTNSVPIEAHYVQH